MAIGERRDTVAVTTTATNIDFQADGGSVLVNLAIASSWDGTVDFQGTIDGANYFNILYYTLSAINSAPSVAQLTSLATARYLLPGPLSQVRISCAAGTTGTLTATYRTIHNASYPNTVQGMAASDAAEVGNPVQMGLSVDEVSPTAAGEGDVRRWRGSAEGDAMVQPTFEGVNIASASGIYAQGPAAHDAAIAGNPVIEGGEAYASLAGVTDVAANDVVKATNSQKGVRYVTWLQGVTASADGESNSAVANVFNEGDTNTKFIVGAYSQGFNESTWDRTRQNTGVTGLASGARTTGTQSSDITTYNARGIVILFDITAVPGSDTVTLSIQGKDPVSNKYFTIVNANAKSSTGQQYLALGLGASDIEDNWDGMQGVAIPRTIRVSVAHSGSGSFTYSVGLMLQA